MATLPDQFPTLRALIQTPPPERHGVRVARWTLGALRDAVAELAHHSISGLSRLAVRAGLRQKRGRLHVHSPDREYATKATAVTDALIQARQQPETVTVLVQDEAGIARQPTLAPTWAPMGTEPRATRSLHANRQHRICAALDAVPGQVQWWAGKHTSAAVLCRFLRQLRAAYGPDRRLRLVWDNWLVHRHDAVVAAAATQPIELRWLPTYAPWLHPIEKLWRWLKQEVSQMHRLATDWDDLKTAIATFLDRFAGPSPDLLRYTGLYVE